VGWYTPLIFPCEILTELSPIIPTLRKVRRCLCEEDCVSPGSEKSRRKGRGEFWDMNVQYHDAGRFCTSTMFGNFRILPEQAGVICAPGWRRD